jgi:pyridinium-3,5-biscarboxylic acid mononucleotide synthase
VITARTTDLPVALEALTTIGVFGARVDLIADAGGGRAAPPVRALGPDCRRRYGRGRRRHGGALPSVVGGLTGQPLIGVPTSVGHGLALNGVTAFLAMLSSCAPGLTVGERRRWLRRRGRRRPDRPSDGTAACDGAALTRLLSANR